MQLTRDLDHLPDAARGAVVALGNFDGLHLGHQAAINEVLRVARTTGKPSAVMTFEPHPRRVFKPELPPLKIYPFAEKVRMLRARGIEHLIVVRFTKEFSLTPAESFVRDVLHGALHASHVVTGDNFVFGHQRGGNYATLEHMGKKLGFSYTALSPVMDEGAPCSSTRIRNALQAGDLDTAARLLGRPYELCRRVIHGDKRGRAIGVPTANVAPHGLFLPAHGVYAIRAEVEEDGTWHTGVANLGKRPTFGGDDVRLEFHSFDPLPADIYGKRLRARFIRRIREEKKFSSVDELTAHIAQDIATAKEILSS